jgi:amidohydrolase
MEKPWLLDIGRELQPEIQTIREYLHQYPELSFQETKTQAYLIQYLHDMGVENIEQVADTGLAVIIQSSSPGKCIALRADMDALPIEEKNETNYTSKHKGIMHACGHDVHMSILMGVIRILHQNPDKWKGSLLAIFQPGEEKLPGGALKIIESGILKRHKAQLIIGQHVMPGMPIGTFGFKTGAYMASTDEIFLRIYGQGGHAAMPELTKDTVAASAEAILSMKSEIKEMSREIPTVLSIGFVEAKGSTNVIPSEVNMQGTFRTMDESFRKYAKQQMHSILKRVTQSYDVNYQLDIIDGYPSLTNHKEYTCSAIEYMQELVGSSKLVNLETRLTGEDFAYYSQKMPSVFYRIGIAGETLGKVNVHNANFDIDPNALLQGTVGMTWLAVQFLNHFNK